MSKSEPMSLREVGKKLKNRDLDEREGQLSCREAKKEVQFRQSFHL